MTLFFRNLTFDKLDALLTEMAKKYKDDIKAADENEAKAALILKLASGSKQMHGTTVRLYIKSSR